MAFVTSWNRRAWKENLTVFTSDSYCYIPVRVFLLLHHQPHDVVQAATCPALNASGYTEFVLVKSNMEFRCFQKLCEMGIAPQPVWKHLKISSTLIAMEAPEMHRTIQLICNLKIPIFALVLPWFPSFSVQKWRPTSHQWVISIGQAATSKAQVFFVSPTLSWLLPAWPRPRHMARKIPRELPKVPCPTLAPHSETGSSPSLPSVSSPPPRNAERNDRNEHLVEMKLSCNIHNCVFW